MREGRMMKAFEILPQSDGEVPASNAGEGVMGGGVIHLDASSLKEERNWNRAGSRRFGLRPASSAARPAPALHR